jgi:hypothetical protein
MIEILAPDLTPLEGVEIPDLEAGQDSGSIPFVLRNTGSDVAHVLVVLQVLDPVSGQWLSSGLPPLDELWPRLRITGQDTANAPAQQLEFYDWTPVGTGRALHLATLLSGGLRSGEIRFHPPATAARLTWSFRLAVIAAEHSYPVPAGARPGILPGLGDYGHSALVRGFQVTAAAPAADQVHVAAGQLVHRGRLVGLVAGAVQLDQLDGAAEALAPGQLYVAVLSAGPTGITVTKGRRGSAPAHPAPPPWEPPIAAVAVRHEAGASEIGSTDIEDLRVFDRYHAEPGAGLQLRVHAGRAIAGGTLRYHSTPTDLMLPPNATTALWQRASGAWELAAPTDPPPETTALGPLWIATTDAAGVSELLDRRALAADTVVIHLRGDLPAAPGPIAEAVVVHDGLILEDVIYRLSGNGGGSAGQTQLDLMVDGATVYPSAAQDDHRPAWPFDAADLIVQGRIHELTELHPGQLLQLTSIEHPTGGTPAWAEALLVCRRP